MFRFENLEIWKLAVEYASEIYKLTITFPREETFGLVSQLRRASVSVSSNIAEGSGASTIKDYKNYLDIAIKSTLETSSLLYIATTQNYLDEKTRLKFYEDAEKQIRKIRAFKKKL